MKKKPKDRERERPDVLPTEPLHYTIDAHLVNLLTWAHRSAGMCAGMRFSHYGHKRMEVEANRRRITYMAVRSGHTVNLEEVSRVLAGDLLPPRRRLAQDAIRRAAVLCEAVRQFGRPNEPAMPEMFVTYLDFLKKGTTLWAHFSGQSKERLLETHRGSVEVPTAVAQFFEWADEDTLVSGDPILRAATLYWGLSILYPYEYERPAIDAIIDHELRAGSIDRHGLLVLPDYEFGESALRLGGIITSAADNSGDLTRYFEHFTLDIARVLVEHHKRLEAFQDREDRLPWLMVRPPDELDRQVFDIIERFGSARTQDIIGELSDPPPLRTLQRRLQRLCKDGLVIKNGARKYAYYRLVERA